MDKKKKILLVEDSAEYLLLIPAALNGIAEIVNVPSAQKALSILEQQPFDLLLLDIGLPDMDGFHLLAKLRANPKTSKLPIFFITGHSSSSDKVMAFSLGAEDYIVKPFDFEELRARVGAKLKRIQDQHSEAEVLVRGVLHLDAAARLIKIGESEISQPRMMDLTPAEYKILRYLMINEGRVLTREQILNAGWTDRGVNVTDRVVDRHVHALRQKLGKYAWYIETVLSEGYRFSSEPKEFAQMQP